MPGVVREAVSDREAEQSTGKGNRRLAAILGEIVASGPKLT